MSEGGRDCQSRIWRISRSITPYVIVAVLVLFSGFGATAASQSPHEEPRQSDRTLSLFLEPHFYKEVFGNTIHATGDVLNAYGGGVKKAVKKVTGAISRRFSFLGGPSERLKNQQNAQESHLSAFREERTRYAATLSGAPAARLPAAVPVVSIATARVAPAGHREEVKVSNSGGGELVKESAVVAPSPLAIQGNATVKDVSPEMSSVVQDLRVLGTLDLSAARVLGLQPVASSVPPSPAAAIVVSEPSPIRYAFPIPPALRGGELNLAGRFGELRVDGATTITGDMTMQGGATVRGDLTVSGTTSFGSASFSSLSVASVSANLVPGSNNAYDLGASTSSFRNIFASSTAYLSGVQTSGSILPISNNSIDLGSYGSAWNEIYASGTLFANVLNVAGSGTSTFVNGISISSGCFRDASGACVGGGGANTGLSNLSSVAINASLTPASNNSIDLGAFGSAWRDLYVSSSLRVGAGAASTTISSSGNITTSGNILPASNNASDLGAFSNAFRDIYASGTIYSGGTIGGAATTTFSNSLAVQGNTRFGNASTDLIDFTGRVSTDFVPNAHDTLDLGSTTTAWNDVFFFGAASGTKYWALAGTAAAPSYGFGFNESDTGVYLETPGTTLDFSLNGTRTMYLSASTLNLIASVVPTTNNTRDLGIATSSFKDIYASGTAYIGASILSPTNNTLDLGGFGNALNDIFTSGTTRVATFSADGSVTLGDATSDTVTLTGRVASDIVPNTNNARDLGAYANAFRDIYTSGTIYSGGTIGGAATTTFSNSLAVAGNSRFGDSAADLIDLTGRIATSIVPNANNSLDLGGVNSWANVYASTTIQTPTLTLTGTTTSTINVANPSFGINTTSTNVEGYVTARRFLSSGGTTGTSGQPLFMIDGGVSGSGMYKNASDSLDFSAVGSRVISLSSQRLMVIGSVVPQSNNLSNSDLGIAGTAWNEIFSSGTVWAAALNADGSVTLGDSTSDTVTVTARVASDLTPSTNNARDLGAYATAWRDIYASGTIYSGGTIGGAATTTFSNNLAVQGNTRLGDASGDLIDITGRISTSVLPNVNNSLDFGGFGNAWSGIFSSGTTQLAVLIADGNVTLGDTTADTLTLNARLASDLIPSTNGTRDLGAFANAFRHLYASGTVFANLLTVAGTTTSTFAGGMQSTALNITSASVTSTFANGIQLSSGCFRDSAGACITAGGTGANTALSNLASVAINASLTPGSNNSIDLGAFGTAWRDVYVSGTIYSGGTIGGAATTTFSNSLAIQGNTRFGDATSDLIDFTGRLSTAIIPNAHNVIGLGTQLLAFNDIFAAGNVSSSRFLAGTVGSVTSPSYSFGGDADSGMYQNILGNTLDFALNGARSLFLSSGGVNIPTGLNVAPQANNSSDLGINGLAWNDIRASGTAALGILTVDGNGTIGDTTSDTLTVTARVASNIVPDSSVRDLGASGLGWRDLYVSSSIRMSTSTVASELYFDRYQILYDHGLAGSNAQFSIGYTEIPDQMKLNESDITFNSTFILPKTNSAISFGSAIQSWGDVYASGTLTIAGAILPSKNNLTDLGSATNAWNELYVSSTIQWHDPPNLASTGDAICHRIGSLFENNGATSCTVSSRRFKHDILSYSGGLDAVLALEAVHYKRNDDNLEEIGLIAEEVEGVEKRLVFYEDDRVTPRGVKYEHLTAVLVSAIQELEARVASSTEELAILSASLEKDGTISAGSSGDQDFNGSSILNVRAIAGLADAWAIREDGVFEIKEIVLAKDGRIVAQAGADQLVGRAKLLQGNGSVRISNALVTATSTIFLTPTTLATQQLSVIEQKQGEFVVAVKVPEASDVAFRYLIVNTYWSAEDEAEILGIAPIATPEPVSTPVEEAPPAEEPTPPPDPVEEAPVEEVTGDIVVPEEPAPSSEPVPEPVLASEPVPEPIPEPVVSEPLPEV